MLATLKQPLRLSARPAGSTLDTERLATLLRRLDRRDDRTLLASAAKILVELLGQWGACILTHHEPHIALTTDGVAADGRRIELARYPEVMAALKSGTVVAVEDVHASTLLDPVRELIPPRIGAIAVVPILDGERRLGVFLVRSRLPRSILPAQRALAQTVGLVTGMLLDPEPEVTAHRSPAAVTNRRVLVVEDDTDHARALEQVLKHEGYEVSLAWRGEDALAQILESPPARVLMDVQLPGLDGIAVAKRMATDERTANVPVLLLSGVDDLASRVRDCDRGELDFLHKPYDLEELLTRIGRVLREAKSLDRWQRSAHLDELTGLGNFRLLEERLTIETARAQRYRMPLTVAVADVDGLKTVNDRQGHQAGNQLLKGVGDALRKELRSSDLPIRYGGDEFMVLLPQTGLDEGVAVCERLLARLRETGISMSLGIASYGAADTSGRALMERADQASYRAKSLGGNQLCVDR